MPQRDLAEDTGRGSSLLPHVACCCALGWLAIRRLWIMAASKPVEPQAGAGLPRWQLALLVGTPIVLGVGAFYLWNRSKTKEGKGAGERKTPEGSASPVQGQDGATRTNREPENMVNLPVHLVPNYLLFLCNTLSPVWHCLPYQTAWGFLRKRVTGDKNMLKDTRRCDQKLTANVAS